MSSITKVKFTACTKLKNLARESFREQSGALCIDFAPLLDTAKLLTVGGDARWIDFRGLISFSVFGSELSNGIKRFEGKTGGVNLAVTGSARRRG